MKIEGRVEGVSLKTLIKFLPADAPEIVSGAFVP